LNPVGFGPSGVLVEQAAAGHLKTSGFTGGGQIGLNKQFNMLVFGIEGDWSWTNKNGRQNDTGPGGVPTFVSTTKEHWISTTRVRLGPTWDRTWLYVTGGFAWARVEADLDTRAQALELTENTRSHKALKAREAAVQAREEAAARAKIARAAPGL
jgi:opacity protein-like surface antigen